MTEHKNAQYLRAIADGKTVQVLRGGEWGTITLFGQALEQLVSGVGTGWEFRIAPETISVTLANGEVRTINAPLREVPTNGTQVWYLTAEGRINNCAFDAYADQNMLKAGLMFATKEDAQAWADLQSEILGVKK